MKPTPMPESSRLQILAYDSAEALPRDGWREHQFIFDGVPFSSVWLTDAAADYLIGALTAQLHEVDETAAGHPRCVCGAAWSQPDGGCRSAAAEVVRLRTMLAEIAPVMLAARSALHALAAVLPLEE